MIKETPVLEKKLIRTRFCDDCGKQLFWGLACEAARCEICGKDLCDNCISHEISQGDYREVYCKPCWSIGELYRIKINELETEIENLQNEWYEKCKTNNKENI